MAKLSMKLKQSRPAKFSTRAYTRCRICGRPHSVLRKYGVCRVCFRELAYKGEIPGVKKAICQILVDEGYIKGMQVKNDTVQGTIVVTLKYQANGEPVIAGLRRVSKPGLRIYTNCEDMPKVMKGLGTAIISTSKGIMTDKAARAEHVGGEVLAYVW